ncbi:MAG TPA: hypothetical protein PK239_12025 [Chitinophagales bacterium]|nr:hypothetical protein [Chitinophagales bacterium]
MFGELISCFFLIEKTAIHNFADIIYLLHVFFNKRYAIGTRYTKEKQACILSRLMTKLCWKLFKANHIKTPTGLNAESFD